MSNTYINRDNFSHLTRGLTYDDKDLDVLENVISGFDKKFGLPSQIISHNKEKGFAPPFIFDGPQIIINCDKYSSLTTGVLRTASINQQAKLSNLTPTLHLNMQSPSLDIPQRVEIPLRYILNGLPSLNGLYMVYLHVLQIEQSQNFVYYGLTKRNWLKRFEEHTKDALVKRSPRSFASLLRNGIVNRKNELYGSVDVKQLYENSVLTGMHHVLCTAGRSRKDAHAVEDYLISKHSIGLKHGLNMIHGQKLF